LIEQPAVQIAITNSAAAHWPRRQRPQNGSGTGYAM
jgi:hypothetical protein